MKTNFAKPTLLSPLKAASQLKPYGSGIRHKSISATVTLTSLIDAFVIIVIYLVVNSGPTEQMDIYNNIKLPKASTMQDLDRSPVVIFRDGGFYIDNQLVPNEQLKAQLEILRDKTSGFLKTGEPAVVIQADQNVGFEKLQPILIASSYAGIKQVKFAVLPKD